MMFDRYQLFLFSNYLIDRGVYINNTGDQTLLCSVAGESMCVKKLPAVYSTAEQVLLLFCVAFNSSYTWQNLALDGLEHCTTTG